MSNSFIYLLTFSLHFFYSADADYPDYKDDGASDQASRETNNVNIERTNEAPYFRLTAYTEKVKVGETVELKCEVQNTTRKSE